MERDGEEWRGIDGEGMDREMESEILLHLITQLFLLTYLHEKTNKERRSDR
jgi:hypothetical protein